MGATKTLVTLFNNETLTAGNPDEESAVASMPGGYGGTVQIEITNGGTGPTVPAECEIWTSPNNSKWYKFGNPLVAGVAASTSYPWSRDITIGHQYLKLKAGKNTVQDVVIHATMSYASEL